MPDSAGIWHPFALDPVVANLLDGIERPKDPMRLLVDSVDDGVEIKQARLPAPRSAIDAVGADFAADAHPLSVALETVQPTRYPKEDLRG